MRRSPSLFVVLSFSLFVSVLSQSSPKIRGLLINCGSTADLFTSDGLRWLADTRYVAAGDPRNLSIPGLLPVLSTLRSFPFRPGLLKPLKFCYSLPTYRGSRYLVRTTYFYGGFDSPSGSTTPPVFDQIVDGTFWTTVNTTADYSAGVASYYEGVFLAVGKNMSVCVACNTYTTSAPFISAIEMVMLEDSVYNGTDFKKYAMGLIARSNFGSTVSILRYPDDRFDRYWQPFYDDMHEKSSTHNLSSSDFWNLPPAIIFNTALVGDQGKSLVLQWPPNALPNAIYYIALYFADTLPENSRTLDVFVNEYNFYSDLTVTSSGLVVFANQWNLSGLTTISLTSKSPLPPLINAGEIFGLFSIGNLTVTKDIIPLVKIKKSIATPPADWSGDPCMPVEYSWTGVNCSHNHQIRVVALNLSNMGLSGSISPDISNLTAITEISFAYNNFIGPIPDLSKLKRLEKLFNSDMLEMNYLREESGGIYEVMLQERRWSEGYATSFKRGLKCDDSVAGFATLLFGVIASLQEA
ncbi:leucine-rich repeat receptor-like serine/threonine-protein kinase [Canna indica]|uniref:Leucine-rich repeat receptor-like serine/threonine-protein kinase n=1 Tax=Canna indica TaxID=4628 RepID=A0AAQ3KNR8_9LILI|nr:leucine-rich repeat receptor-like serine/threonine-protein kinase [Canna indica]